VLVSEHSLAFLLTHNKSFQR